MSPMSSSKILYVEDDESLGFVTRDNLELAGYTVEHYQTGEAAMSAIRRNQFDLCILDIMLPDLDGFTLAQAIRDRNQEVPILFLTARSLKEDRLKGLRLGADDYLTKPFSIEELLLKVEIFLKRRKFVTPQKKDIFNLGQFEFDYPNLILTWEKQGSKLTQREADLLKLLIETPNEVIKRSIILEQIWGEDDYFLGRSLDVFISRLRKRLKPDPEIKIENVHGVGFRLSHPYKG